MKAHGRLSRLWRSDLRSNGLECAYFPQLRLAANHL
jgi:hypothetical protein